MRLTVLTLFPEMIEQAVGSSITGRALQNGVFELETIQIRNFAVNEYGKVDDYCYGGGTGMLMMAEPIWQAWQNACEFPAKQRRTIHLSPRGQVFNQAKAAELAKTDHLILLCGHYEGIDQRVLDQIVDEELSIGDYVLTGGELAACVVIDALSRLIPGVLPNEDAFTKESHMAGLLEYPQFTRPSSGMIVRFQMSFCQVIRRISINGSILNLLKKTMIRRPDLFAKQKVTADEWEKLINLVKNEK